MYDVIVVGGGPAGMTAALYARRNGKTALVIEKAGFGGQITHSPKVENYPGTISMSGNEFADSMLDQILAQGAEIEFETVTSVTEEDGKKVVSTEEGSRFEGKTVILATGVKHRMLGLPGEEELVGEGISFCAVCDGDFYAGQSVCMAGGVCRICLSSQARSPCRRFCARGIMWKLSPASRLQDFARKMVSLPAWRSRVKQADRRFPVTVFSLQSV